MTLLEAYKHKVGNNVSDADAIAALSFAGLNSSDTWNPDDQFLKCRFYTLVLDNASKDGMGVTSISEGGYSISYDKTDKTNYLYALALESGCKDLISKYNPNPVVKNKSYIW